MAAICNSCGSIVKRTYICKNCGYIFCAECMQRTAVGTFFNTAGRSDKNAVKEIGAAVGINDFVVDSLASKKCPSCGMDNAWASKRIRWTVILALFGFILTFTGFQIEDENNPVLVIGAFLLFISFYIALWPSLVKQVKQLSELNKAMKSTDVEMKKKYGVEYIHNLNFGENIPDRYLKYVAKKIGISQEEFVLYLKKEETEINVE